MRNRSISLAIALLLAAFSSRGHAQAGRLPPEEPGPPPGFTAMPAAGADSVRAVLRGYLEAVRSHDGTAAARLVTRGTRAYYAQMRDLAMTASEAKVRDLALIDRLSVLMLRHRVPPDVLRTLTGDSVFAYTISDGWVQAPAADPPAPTLVFANGDRAMMKLEGLFLQMQREEGAWRWDMLPVIRSDAMRVPDGMKEEDFISLVLQTSNGRPMTPSVWQPVQQ